MGERRGRGACGTRAAMKATWLLATVSCASPIEPSSAPPLAPGSYVLTVVAADAVVVDGQVMTACRGAGQGGYGFIMAEAVVENDGTSSRVRPNTAAGGDFDIRLVRGTNAPQLGMSVSGTIRGVVINTKYPPGGPPADARATFLGSASGTDNPLEGVVMGDRVVTDGTVGGDVAVGNAGGSSTNCASGTVRWELSRLVP
jgi:hypothetical protein